MGDHSGFWFGSDVEILFSGWPKSHGLFHYLLALLLVFTISVLAQLHAMTPMTAPKMTARSLFPHAALHGFRTFVAYLVLLCVITFNAGVIITILLGHVAGYIGLTIYIKYNEPALMASPPPGDAKA